MRTTQYQTWRRSSTNYIGASHLGKIDLSDAYYQIELYKEAKRYMHNQHFWGTVQDVPNISGIEKLIKSSKIASNQPSTESKVLWSFQTMCWWMELPKSSSKREWLQSKVDNVRKILLLMRKNLTQNQSIALAFCDTPFQRRDQIQKMLKK